MSTNNQNNQAMSVKKTAHSETPTEAIARLTAENASLKARQPKQRALSCKVGKKGGICVYGLGRFPVTLYAGQWVRLLDFASQIETFAQDNAQLIVDTIAAKEAEEANTQQ